MPSQLKSRIVNALRTARGHPVSVQDLIEAMYHDRADGGALTAEQVLYFCVMRLRREGFPIRCRSGIGYSYGSPET